MQSFRAACSRCVNEMIWPLKCQWKVIERMGKPGVHLRVETLHLGRNQPEPGTFGPQLIMSALTTMYLPNESH